MKRMREQVYVGDGRHLEASAPKKQGVSPKALCIAADQDHPRGSRLDDGAYDVGPQADSLGSAIPTALVKATIG